MIEPEIKQSIYPTSFAAKRKARRFAMQGLYEWQMTGNPVNGIEAHTRAINAMHKVDVEYYHELLAGVVTKVAMLDNCCAPLLDRNEADLTVVERAILRIGVYELSSRLEIPYKVVIDEAIELAKHFGATDSYKYINGVLDKLAKQLRATEVAATPPKIK